MSHLHCNFKPPNQLIYIKDYTKGSQLHIYKLTNTGYHWTLLELHIPYFEVRQTCNSENFDAGTEILNKLEFANLGRVNQLFFRVSTNGRKSTTASIFLKTPYYVEFTIFSKILLLRFQFVFI